MTGSNRTPPKPFDSDDVPTHVVCPHCDTLYDLDAIAPSLDGRIKCRTCLTWIPAIHVPSTMRKRNPGKLAYRARKKAEKAAKRAVEGNPDEL